MTLPASLPAASSLDGVHVLVIGAGARKKSLSDDQVKARLESLGCVVTVKDATPVPDVRRTGFVTPVQTDGQDLIIITATSTGITVGGMFKDAKLPLICWQSDVAGHLNLTGKRQDVDWGRESKPELTYLYLVNAPHPLQAGLPNGMVVPFTTSQKNISWGRPGIGASVIATIPGESEKACLFSYDKGAMMDGDFPAPARRVFLFLDANSFGSLNEAGCKLFDAAVIWAAGRLP